MRWLEEEVTRITGKNDQMLKENLLLRQVLGEQGQKIQELLRREEEREQRRKNKENDKESRVCVKTEHKDDTSSEPPAKKPALWRPGLDTSSSKPSMKRSITDDHLSKMRLNIIQDHTLPSMPSTPSPYNGLQFDQVKTNFNLNSIPCQHLYNTNMFGKSFSTCFDQRLTLYLLVSHDRSFNAVLSSWNQRPVTPVSNRQLIPR